MDVEPLSATPQFAADEVVLCFHGPLLYEAKVCLWGTLKFRIG